MDRRRFLQQSAALSAAASMPFSVTAQNSRPYGSIHTRAIPSTNEALPVLGIGAPPVFINEPDEGRDLPKEIIRNVINMGGRLFDTPAFFRPNDPILGELLTEMGGLQDDLFLAGKITVEGKQQGIDHVNRVINYLGKDTLDLLLVHNMRDMENNWPTLKQFRDEGKARYIGVSLTRKTDYKPLTDFMKAERPDFVMTGYSITQQGPAEQDVMAIAQDLGIAIIGAEPFKAIEDGAFFSMVADVEVPEFAREIGINSWAQYSLKWILGDPAVTSIVYETSTPRYVFDNMTAGYGEFPDQAMRKQMSDFLLSLA